MTSLRDPRTRSAALPAGAAACLGAAPAGGMDMAGWSSGRASCSRLTSVLAFHSTCTALSGPRLGLVRGGVPSTRTTGGAAVVYAPAYLVVPSPPLSPRLQYVIASS